MTICSDYPNTMKGWGTNKNFYCKCFLKEDELNVTNYLNGNADMPRRFNFVLGLVRFGC